MSSREIYGGNYVLSPVEVTRVLAWLVEQSPDLKVPTFSEGECRCCGHGPYFHRLDDAANIAPNDPAAKFRCIWPEPEGPAVQICACSKFIPSKGQAGGGSE